jgi:hypothetical protein
METVWRRPDWLGWAGGFELADVNSLTGFRQKIREIGPKKLENEAQQFLTSAVCLTAITKSGRFAQIGAIYHRPPRTVMLPSTDYASSRLGL